MRLSECYASKANRDERYKALKASGMQVRKSVISNQRLSPHFVSDSGMSDQGLGNAYNTFYPKLYCIDEEY